MSLAVTVLLSSLLATPAAAHAACLDPDALVRLDGEWERALLEGDGEALETLLAEDFVWVHDHASRVDGKASLLELVVAPPSGAAVTRSRERSRVETRVLGSTGVVTGFTRVDRGERPTTYHFQRTWVEVGGRCLLLANHTMALPEGAPPEGLP